MNSWILQISAGTGPHEVRCFVYHLGQELLRQCHDQGLDVLSVTSHGEESAPRSLEISCAGTVPPALADMLGTHVLLAKNNQRGRRSRKRWFAGVSLHPAEEPLASVWPESDDLEISACRAGGPGGQHVNKTASAVRVLHRPTGVAVRAAGERSQAMNRKRAVARIAAILARRQRERGARNQRARRLSHYHFERGSAVMVWRRPISGQGIIADTRN